MASGDDELIASISAISNRTPQLRQFPGVLLGAATSDDPLGNAESFESMRDAVEKSRALREMDADHQLSTFAALDDSTRSRLQMVGYVPPHRSDPGFFERWLGRPVGYVVGGTLGNAVEFVNKGLSGVVGNVRHVYRAMEYMDIEEQVRQGKGAFRNESSQFMQNPFSSEMGRAWRLTKDGDNLVPFPEKALAEFDVALPKEFVDIAADGARGFTDAELIAVYGQTGEQALQHPLFKQAVETLNATKISFGRRTALGLGFDPGSTPFRIFSGSVDAAVDIGADPSSFAPIGKLRAARLDEYLILKKGSEGYRMAYQHLPQTRRAIDRIATVLSASGADEQGVAFAAGQLRAEFGQRISPLLDDLVKLEDKSPKGVLDYMGGWVDTAKHRQGDGSFHLKQYYLKQGALEQVLAKAKGSDATTAIVDALRKTPGAGAAAKMVRKLTVVTADGVFNPESKESLEIVRQVALLALPRKRVNEIVNDWATTDIAGRYDLYKSTLKEIGNVVDIEKSDIASYWDDLVNGLDEAEGAGRVYGVRPDGTKVGRYEVNGTMRSGGVFPYQVENVQWAVPNAAEFFNSVKNIQTIRRAVGRGYIPEGMVNGVMNKIWKPGKVASPAQGIRQGAEEALGYAIDQGVLPYFKAVLARGAQKRLMKIEESERGKVATILGDWFAGAKSRLISDEDIEAARDLAAISPSVMLPILNPHTQDLIDVPSTMLKSLGKGKMQRITMRRSGLHKVYERGHQHSMLAWQGALAEKVKDRAFKIAYKGTREEAVEGVEKMLRKNPKLQGRTAYFAALKTERGEAGAFKQWSEDIVDATRSLTHSPDGDLLPEVAAALDAGKVPAIEDLMNIAEGLRPMEIVASDITEVVDRGRSLAAFLSEKMFTLQNKQMAYTSRGPIGGAEMVKAKRRLLPHLEFLKEQGLSDADAYEQYVIRAADLAGLGAIKHIDQPNIKTQFARTHQALFPFWTAWEQFMRRQGTRLWRNPEAARRFQLMMMGLEHSGLTEKDEQGNMLFHFPGVAYAYKPLSKAMSLITGNNLYEQIPLKFTGNVKYVLPGADDPGRPGVGPLLTVPLPYLRERFPEFARGAIDAVLGPRGQMRKPLWEQFAPTVAVKAIKPFATHPDEAAMVSVINNSISYLEAAGHGLPEDATAIQKDIYMDRVRGWARTMLVMRGAFGIGVPGGANIEAAESLSDEFRSYLKTLPFNEAIEAFVRVNPDADPYTVFQSKTDPSANKPLPATQAAAKWMSENQAFLKKYGAAATWFLPAADEEFDPTIYREQLAMGLRHKRSPEEFWVEQKVAAAANEYYRKRDEYLALAEGLYGPAREQMDLDWQDYSTRFKESHPLFAQKQAEGETRAVVRSQTLGAIEAALNDPMRPKTGSEQAIADLMERFNTYRTQLTSLRDRRDQLSNDYKKVLTQQMMDYGRALEDETARTLFDSNIRPDLPEV